jgi:hypothetical protein
MIAPKIKRMKNYEMEKRYTSIEPIDIRVIHFAITSLIHILIKMQLFPYIFGHRVTYQAKEQQMPVRHFTQRLGNIFIHSIQIFLFFMKF